MDETSFWNGQRKKLNPFGHFDRIESLISPGFPDVDYCLKGGFEGHIELKYRSDAPARPATACFPPGKGLRKAQIVWITERLYYGGRVFVLAGIARKVLLIRMTRDLVERFNHLTYAELLALDLLQHQTYFEALSA